MVDVTEPSRAGDAGAHCLGSHDAHDAGAPDLAIEVVFWHGEHDALEAHRLIGVREVWVCKHGELAFLVLGKDGQYTESSRSSLLPFLESDELADWLYRPNILSGAKFKRLFRAWATETLVPRYRFEVER